MLLCSGLCTNCPSARPSSGIFPYLPFLMKTTCAPSHVIREGSDLNQHGQAGRQEQASSSSPVTFQEVLSAAAALAGRPNAVMPHIMRAGIMDFLSIILFIDSCSGLKRCGFLGRT